MKTIQELMDEAKRYIDASSELRLDWAHASLEDRNLILIRKVYDIGFDDGYEHRKKVEGFSK